MKELEGFTYLQFINELDEPIKSLVIALDNDQIPLIQIGNEIAAQPSTGMTTKGSNNWDNSIFQKILNELALIICKGGNEELAKTLSSEATLTTQVIIAASSNFIGQKLGFAAALCTPFVILCFATILKAGLNTFCSEFK
jgi:hypothetical protein